jgi:5-methylcytosine-specific restriction endonuclease McrA
MATRISQRDLHRCQYAGCHRTSELAVHHIIPRRLGGTDHPWNLITLCREHHGAQPVHHYDSRLCVSDAELATEKAQRDAQQAEKTRLAAEARRDKEQRTFSGAGGWCL